jgi:hypothetical protein
MSEASEGPMSREGTPMLREGGADFGLSDGRPRFSTIPGI